MCCRRARASRVAVCDETGIPGRQTLAISLPVSSNSKQIPAGAGAFADLQFAPGLRGPHGIGR